MVQISACLLILHCMLQLPAAGEIDHSPRTGTRLVSASVDEPAFLQVEQRAKTEVSKIVHLRDAIDAPTAGAVTAITRLEIERTVRAEARPLRLYLLSSKIFSTSL